MREIKFRAWDGNKMYDSYSIIDGEMCTNADFINMVENKGTKCIFLQSTSLKDKNGVEIYEGDIVIVGNQYEEEYPIESKSTVSFNNGSFRLDFHDAILNNSFSTGIDNSNWNVEVIGNIYENPELLEQE